MQLPILRAKHKILNSKSAFTLIELLVVITIIAILVAAATVSWTQAQKKARDGKRKGDLKSLQQAFELYFEEYNSYPLNNSNGEIVCHTGEIITWGGAFKCDTGSSNERTYMNPTPKDPQNIYPYYYEAFTSGRTVTLPTGTREIFLTYQLGASLENSNDPEYCTGTGPGGGIDCIAEQKLPCYPNMNASNLSYCVIQP